ncbi:MAG: hypothetical protein ACRDZO_15245 [Egibacteraceae bacterium]
MAICEAAHFDLPVLLLQDALNCLTEDLGGGPGEPTREAAAPAVAGGETSPTRRTADPSPDGADDDSPPATSPADQP